MARKLNQREKWMLVIGAVTAGVILLFTLGQDWLKGWSDARASVARARSQLKEVEGDKAKQAGLLAIVPVFQAPQPEEEQKFLFRDKLHEQLKKAGINTEPLQIINARKMPGVAYKVLKIKCKGKCKVDQLLDFLVALKENPYAVSVEELRMQCDPKEPPEKRTQLEVELTVSTFVK